MPLIGTAGHVDHGKSTLVQALTNRDPDRWAEEKRRGLTIDLGFAWADLGDGVVASFVDVPGHERYLKNMLAGVESIEIALLVVAANEGWKPQTEEHVAALDLLEVAHGVVALTKTDLVDQDEVDLAQLEVEDSLVGTTLQGSKIIPVSALEGVGLEHLTEELRRLIGISPDQHGQPRLWVDRVFSVAGAGTVVTGSMLNGRFAIGDEVQVYPGAFARIRSIQSHEESTDVAEPGRRVALGLSGVDVSDVRRGSMIGLPGEWDSSDRFSSTLRLARYIEDLPDRGAYQLHIGTVAQNVIIEARADDRAVLRLSHAVPAAMGDRFVLRDSGRRLIAAGGRILDPHPAARRRQALADAKTLTPGAEPDENAQQLLDTRGTETGEKLARDSGGGRPGQGIEVAGRFITESRIDDLEQRAVELVGKAHTEKPLDPGLPLATLATRLSVAAPLAEEVVRRSASLELRGPNVASLSHNPALSSELASAWQRTRSKLAEDLAVPASGDLGLGIDALHLLVRQGELVRISDALVYLPDQINEITRRVAGLQQPFTVGDFKEALGVSRKYAMPLLEWLDSNQFTVRRGEGRMLGPRLTRDGD